MNELPTEWVHESTEHLRINGLEVKYTGPDDDYKAAAKVLTNIPMPSQRKYFYFEVEIIDGGSNGMIGIGFCTKSTDQTKMPGQEKNSWGYHGDDGYSYCSGSGEPYGWSCTAVKPSGYIKGDIIGCYINFKNKIVFYTKNGINLGIACYLPDDLKDPLYPCVGFRSPNGSIKANFGNDEFKYSALDNNYISNEIPDLMIKSLEENQSNANDLCNRGETNVISNYEETLGDLTEKLRYQGEKNYLMKKYNESITNLKELLKIKPNDTWAKNALKLAEEFAVRTNCRGDNYIIDIGDIGRTEYDRLRRYFRFFSSRGLPLDYILYRRRIGGITSLFFRPEDFVNVSDFTAVIRAIIAAIITIIRFIIFFIIGGVIVLIAAVIILVSPFILLGIAVAAFGVIAAPAPTALYFSWRSYLAANSNVNKNGFIIFLFLIYNIILECITLTLIGGGCNASYFIIKKGFPIIGIGFVIIEYGFEIIKKGFRYDYHYDSKRFTKKFNKWTSRNEAINEFIKKTQRDAKKFDEIIEWIPFNKFTRIKYISEGGFGTVFKAIWTEGYIYGYDNKKDDWVRNKNITVCLKRLNKSNDINEDFLNEVNNQYKHGGDSSIEIYGITKNPKESDYMIVMQYAKQGSLRKLLDSRYYDLNWTCKVDNLYYIAQGLYTIHKAGLVHKDFHSGNIVSQNLFYPYITDFGLCKPVSPDSDSEELFGVLPYVAPELLRASFEKKPIEYTQESDIYSFGIIMSEIFNGYPPYYGVPHNGFLAEQIRSGERPKIKCKVPELLLDLMNRCLDDEPKNRPSAEELVSKLRQYRKDIENKKANLYKEVKAVENSAETLPARLNYKLHENASYKSSCLSKGLNSVSRPVDVVEIFD